MSLTKQNESLGDDFVKMRTRRKQDICFANVDLEIESKDDLQPLIDAFGENVYVLYHDRLENGNDFASLEVYLDIIEVGICGEVEKTITAFCELIENLSLDSRNIWDQCREKIFDIGFESGNTENTFNTKIQSETIKRITDIGASIVITIYPVLNYVIKRKEEIKN